MKQKENRVEGGKEEGIKEHLDNVKLSKTLETGVSGEKEYRERGARDI